MRGWCWNLDDRSREAGVIGELDDRSGEARVIGAGDDWSSEARVVGVGRGSTFRLNRMQRSCTLIF